MVARGTRRQLSRASMFVADTKGSSSSSSMPNAHKRGASGAPSGASLDGSSSKSTSARHHKRSSSAFMSSIFPSRDAKLSASAAPAPAPASTTMTAAEVVAAQTSAAVAWSPPPASAAGATAGPEHQSNHRVDGGADPRQLEEGEGGPPSWPNDQGGGGGADVRVVPPDTPDALKGERRRIINSNTRDSREGQTAAKSDTELMIGEIQVTSARRAVVP